MAALSSESASESSQASSALLTLSNNLADAVEGTGCAVVSVRARQQRPSSGVHWRPGVIVTADHTIKPEEEISVSLADNRTVLATLVGRDPSSDLAVLRLEEVELPTIETADSSLLRVGQLVLAVGRARDGGLSASLGVISALSGAWRTWYGGQIDQFIRPDLSLYPGFSGGPLINTQGQVVGINITGPRRMVLSVPASTVDDVVSQLLDKGRIPRGYLGLSMQPVRLPDALKQSLGLPGSGGVIVINVEPNGPSEQAGVLIGDVLVALEGTPVSDTGDVLAQLGSDRVGKTLSVQVVRGGTEVQLAIKIAERSR